MATIICMDGLACDPDISFAKLKLVLEGAGHSVKLTEIGGIKSHEDRIRAVTGAYKKARDVNLHEKIVLLGHSAGGSAVRIAAECLGDAPPDGIIMLSPAMPRWIWFATPTLLGVMVKRITDMALAKKIHLSNTELLKLLAPIPNDILDKVLGKQTPIAGNEARNLAFMPDRLGIVKCQVLHIWGDSDNWIRPSAQMTLGRMMRKRGVPVTFHVLKNCGHSTLLSAPKIRNELYNRILSWLKMI